MNIEEKSTLIIRDIRQEKGTNPAQIFARMASHDYISIHGPEHHVLDGACILMAFYNAGGKIDIDAGLKQMFREGLKMPGAMCGLWGVCGAVSSVGAALAIIDGTGPLTDDGSWGEHMAYTSAALAELGKVNGPRCCKRDAHIAFETAVEYINSHYDVHLEYDRRACIYSEQNMQCIKERCPFYRERG